jgi:RNA-directed DNA polymerase
MQPVIAQHALRRPPGRHHPSRHQAGEYLHYASGRSEDFGLRRGEVDGCSGGDCACPGGAAPRAIHRRHFDGSRYPPDPDRRGHGDRTLHVPGASPRRKAGRARLSEVTSLTTPFRGTGRRWGAFRTQCTRLWYRTLRRRSQKTRLTWDRMTSIADAWLPPARILHPWPEQRLAALIQGKSRMQ